MVGANIAPAVVEAGDDGVEPGRHQCRARAEMIDYRGSGHAGGERDRTVRHAVHALRDDQVGGAGRDPLAFRIRFLRGERHGRVEQADQRCDPVAIARIVPGEDAIGKSPEAQRAEQRISRAVAGTQFVCERAPSPEECQIAGMRRQRHALDQLLLAAHASRDHRYADAQAGRQRPQRQFGEAAGGNAVERLVDDRIDGQAKGAGGSIHGHAAHLSQSLLQRR